MRPLVASLDVGGTRIKSALVSARGELFERRITQTGAERGPGPVFEAICTMAEELVEVGGALAVGVGFAGSVDADEGRILEAPNLPGWGGVPLRKRLETRLGLPVALDNDANCYALGEAWVGAGADHESVVAITLGTGIGGGIVLDGGLWRGVAGAAGEFGHIILDPEGPPCFCGRGGCWEVHASATAVVRRIRELLGESAPESSREVYERARAGEASCQAVLRETGAWIGRGLALVCHSLQPSCIVIGGGLSGAWEYFEGPMREALEEFALDSCRRGVEIIQSALGEDAAVVGASRAAWDLVPDRK